MGLLDSVIGALGQGQGGGGNAALLNAVIGMLGSNGSSGGLSGLIEKFQRSGLGDVAGSWVGTGQNQPVSPDQLRNVFGDDELASLGQQAGTASQGDLLGQLSQMLPQLVDQLTPNGRVPADGGAGGLGDLLGGLLRR